MGCCNEGPNRHTRRIPDADTLPEQVIGCMARLAFALAAQAEYHYTGREDNQWDWLTSEQQADFALKVREALKGTKPNPHNSFEVLFHNFSRLLVTTV
jgi:hypothetical protein